MESSYIGMPKYLEILNKTRLEGKPIGPQHHLYDRHLKAWLQNNPQKEIEARKEKVNKTNPAQITKEDADKIKLELQKIRERLQSTKQLLERTPKPTLQTAVAQQQDEAARLRDKLNKINKQKIADALKVDTRVDHIKSAGQL